MLEKSSLSIYFVTHNGATTVRKAIDSLIKTGRCPSSFVINNGCHQGHHRAMKDCPIPQISFDRNLPLATVWNKAILFSKTPYVCISNDDVLFEEDWLEKARKAFEQKGIHQVNMAYPMSSYSCFILHKRLIAKIGWFDPRFPTYCWEDEDWHLRMQEYAKKEKVNYPVAFTEAVNADKRLRIKDHLIWGKDFYKADGNKEFFHKKWKKVPATEPGLDPKSHVLKGKIRYVRVLDEVDPWPDVTKDLISRYGVC